MIFSSCLACRLCLSVVVKVTKDLTGGSFKGHYSIRCLLAIDVKQWKEDLGKWAEEKAIHVNMFTGEIDKNV